MYDSALRDTLAQKLTDDFRRHEMCASMQIGSVTIYVAHRYAATDKTAVDIGCNWPAIGTVDPEQTAQFAKDLQNAADIARETEKRLEQAGYLIFRSL